MILVLSKFLRHQAGSFSAAQKSRTEEVWGDGLISGFVGNIVNRSALKVGAWVGPFRLHPDFRNLVSHRKQQKWLLDAF